MFFCLFGLSEKHTKIFAIFLFLRKRPKYEEDFFKFCVFLRKSELVTLFFYCYYLPKHDVFVFATSEPNGNETNFTLADYCKKKVISPILRFLSF